MVGRDRRARRIIDARFGRLGDPLPTIYEIASRKILRAEKPLRNAHDLRLIC